MWYRGVGLAVVKRQAATGDTWPVVRTPPSRGLGGIHPGRISRMWNVGTPSESRRCPGKPTVRKAQSSGGNRMAQQANAGGRKATGNRERVEPLRQAPA